VAEKVVRPWPDRPDRRLRSCNNRTYTQTTWCTTSVAVARNLALHAHKPCSAGDAGLILAVLGTWADEFERTMTMKSKRSVRSTWVELNWTELTRTSRPSYTSRWLVSHTDQRVSVTTYFVLIVYRHCCETRSLSSQHVHCSGTVQTAARKLLSANCSSVQFMCCKRALSTVVC